jgi:hypothetical protein
MANMCSSAIHTDNSETEDEGSDPIFHISAVSQPEHVFFRATNYISRLDGLLPILADAFPEEKPSTSNERNTDVDFTDESESTSSPIDDSFRSNATTMTGNLAAAVIMWTVPKPRESFVDALVRLAEGGRSTTFSDTLLADLSIRLTRAYMEQLHGLCLCACPQAGQEYAKCIRCERLICEVSL